MKRELHLRMVWGNALLLPGPWSLRSGASDSHRVKSLVETSNEIEPLSHEETKLATGLKM